MPNANDNISGVFGSSSGAPLVEDGYVTEQLHSSLKGRNAADSHPASAINWSEYGTNPRDIADEVKSAPTKYALKTSLGTSSSKDIGSATGQVPDKAILDTRLGTTGDLGTAATRDVGESDGNVMEVGAFGLGSLSGLLTDYDANMPCGFYHFSEEARPSPGFGERATIHVINNGRYGFQLAGRSVNNDFSIRSVTSSSKEPWVDLYHTGNILGTVSQSGGVPTGAIIESGSNVNGSYVKYADGTMICRHDLGQISSGTQPIQNEWLSRIVNWTYPAIFNAPPMLSGSAKRITTPGSVNPLGFAGRLTSVNPSNTVADFIYGSFTGPDSTISVSWGLVAVGRWY